MLEKILTDLNGVEGVKGSLVAGKDGMIISERVPEGINLDLASAMAATLYGASEKAAKELNEGDVVQAMVEGTDGKMLLVSGKETILMTMTESNVNLGLIRIEMKKSINEIEESL